MFASIGFERKQECLRVLILERKQECLRVLVIERKQECLRVLVLSVNKGAYEYWFLRKSEYLQVLVIYWRKVYIFIT